MSATKPKLDGQHTYRRVRAPSAKHAWVGPVARGTGAITPLNREGSGARRPKHPAPCRPSRPTTPSGNKEDSTPLYQFRNLRRCPAFSHNSMKLSVTCFTEKLRGNTALPGALNKRYLYCDTCCVKKILGCSTPTASESPRVHGTSPAHQRRFQAVFATIYVKSQPGLFPKRS